MAYHFLGVAFFAIQVYAWYVLTWLQNECVFYNPNASQSFVYVFTGMHLLHIFAGYIIIGKYALQVHTEHSAG
jgi:cytochrome c oxidase subunit 3